MKEERFFTRKTTKIENITAKKKPSDVKKAQTFRFTNYKNGAFAGDKAEIVGNFREINSKK